MSGMGKRFVNAGYTSPKPLIEVDGKPIIEHVVNLFPGVKKVSFICNTKHVEETNVVSILKKICPESHIHVVEYDKIHGPVESILSIEDLILDDEEILISYCDYGTKWNFNAFLNFINENKLDGAIPCYIGFHPHMLGSDNYAYCQEEDLILQKIQEKKPFTDNKMNEYASNGTYYFKSGKLFKQNAYKLIKSGQKINNEFYCSMIYNFMVEDNKKIGIFEIEKMLQWGTPSDLEDYKQWSEYFNNKINNLKKINCPKNTTLILPMAGNGSRFFENGYRIPKPLIDINGLPMFKMAVDSLPFCDNYVFGILKQHDDEFQFDKNIKFYFENSTSVIISNVLKGQACSCEYIINETNLNIDDPILISACDNGAFYNSSKLEELFEDENIDVIVWSFKNHRTSKNNPEMYAWLDVDENKFIKKVYCKKWVFDDPAKHHAIIGTMFFRKASYFMDGLRKNYDENITSNNEFYVDDVLNQIINAGLKVKVFEVQNYICWGTPNDLKTYLYWREFFEEKNDFLI